MQHNPHHAMNGCQPINGASTSSHNYDDYPASHSNQPLFNNNQSQPIQAPQNQWSQGMQMNGQHPMPPQHQSPFNQPPWGNQMPLSSFPMNVNTMPAFNMNFLPISQAYLVPVSADDEPTLLFTLFKSRKRGR
jgi:hypothetical protein